MCGIFGLASGKQSKLSEVTAKEIIDRLFLLSESRGKESSGVAVMDEGGILVYKHAKRAARLVGCGEYRRLMGRAAARRTVIGHARLVTNGAMEDNNNNQPVIKDGIVGVHNGIVVNDGELWRAFPGLRRKSAVDTEILFGLVRHFLDAGSALADSVRETFRLIKGSASIAAIFNDIDCLLLATNTGSLYACAGAAGGDIVFASERIILESLIKKNNLEGLFSAADIFQIFPGSGIIIDLDAFAMRCFSFESRVADGRKVAVRQRNLEIKDMSPASATSISVASSVFAKPLILDVSQGIDSLKRCTRCVLPETMPFISFDERGVCNYCRNYAPVALENTTTLEATVASYRKNNGEPDCLVAFSGGRDSSYGLHYLKKTLKMNPVAYSYDWGMITDLGRRNQARMCGSLGIEHILISADIQKKRANIRKNVIAWLKKPDLGMVPLFMAGDKEYFYYANKLKEQMRLPLMVLCANPLEKTDFKYGFAGIRPRSTGQVGREAYNVSMANNFRLMGYYGRGFLSNRGYLNASLADTLLGYLSYSFLPHDFLFLFKYLRWDEATVDATLKNEYDWETAADTPTTWRIGDGTAAFYNYIYRTVAGFTEADTFRSNQVREGMLTREQALGLVSAENQPRYESIKWYCDTIGIDFESALGRINAITKLYKN